MYKYLREQHGDAAPSQSTVANFLREEMKMCPETSQFGVVQKHMFNIAVFCVSSQISLRGSRQCILVAMDIHGHSIL